MRLFADREEVPDGDRLILIDRYRTRLGPREAGQRRQLHTGRQRSLVVLGMDAVTLLLAAVALELTSRGSASEFSLPWFGVFSLLVMGRFIATKTYMRPIRPETIEDAKSIVIATALAAMATLTLQVFSSNIAGTSEEISRLWLFSTVYLIAGRMGLRLRAFDVPGREGAFSTPTLIFGAGKVGQLVADRLLSDPRSGLRPVGFLDKDPLQEEGMKLPVLGRSWDLENIVADYDIGHIVITFSTAPTHVAVDLIRRCERLNVVVSVVPRLFESTQGRVSLDYFGAVPLLTMHLTDPEGIGFRLKYLVDRIAAFLAIILLLPVFVVTTIAVLVSVGRPILFQQTRVGKNGKTFKLLKFRSMRERREVSVAEPPSLVPGVAPGGVEGDDRRTRVGTILRRWSIDELPQLINVLRGEMSIVGPRPERTEFVEQFGREIYRYEDRHRVKVGITGWAQINGLRGKTSLQDRVEWDNFYIENWSPWLDLKIILLTLVALVGTSKLAE